jgi:serine protease Do
MESSDAKVVQQATPAVVNISLWKVKPPLKPGDSPRRVKVYGSGFIIDPSGIIVTNKHVIDGAIGITVIMANGDQAPAKLLAPAAMLDVALVKIDVGHPLPYLKWANSDDVKVGDPVLTIGNPLGIGLSVSAGIVSALNRDIKDTPFDNYIQTDAAINHGNSGGPLIDQDGNVVAIDTALINPDSGGFIGIGFAVPSNSAKFVVDRLLDPNHPKPGWLGVSLQDLTPELAKALGVPPRAGSIISAIDPGSPASLAALRPGDVLEKIDNESQTDSRAFLRDIVMMPVGAKAQLTIWRDGKQQSIATAVAEWPNVMPAGGVMNPHMAAMMIQKAPDPGVKLQPITEATRKQYSLDPKLDGVVVASVEQDSEAHDLGIVPGDVITSVQGEAVTTPAQVTHAVMAAHEQHRPYLAVLIQNKDGSRWVSISIGDAS